MMIMVVNLFCVVERFCPPTKLSSTINLGEYIKSEVQYFCLVARFRRSPSRHTRAKFFSESENLALSSTERSSSNYGTELS